MVVLELLVKSHLLKVIYPELFIKNFLSKVIHQKSLIEGHLTKESSFENHQSRVINQKSSIKIIFMEKLSEMESANLVIS